MVFLFTVTNKFLPDRKIESYAVLINLCKSFPYVLILIPRVIIKQK